MRPLACIAEAHLPSEQQSEQLRMRSKVSEGKNRLGSIFADITIPLRATTISSNAQPARPFAAASSTGAAFRRDAHTLIALALIMQNGSSAIPTGAQPRQSLVMNKNTLGKALSRELAQAGQVSRPEQNAIVGLPVASITLPAAASIAPSEISLMRNASSSWSILIVALSIALSLSFVSSSPREAKMCISKRVGNSPTQYFHTAVRVPRNFKHLSAGFTKRPSSGHPKSCPRERVAPLTTNRGHPR
jgi:hypothetical protein